MQPRLLKLTCALYAAFLLHAGTANSAERPNILFILADDVGQEVLGCYGGQSYSTPHLDELARTGMKFRHGFSMPVCHPTRLTLMTGKYPFRHGQVTWGDFPEAEAPYTWANIVADSGYATHIAGKWQLCLLRDDLDHPHRLGFDHFDLFGWHEGPRFYEPMIYRDGAVREDTKGHYGPDLYVRSLIEFMKSNRNRPFLAYYSMAVCHEVTDDLEQPVPHGPFGRYDNYAEMVAEMDRAVGRLTAALNALGLRENTLIIFTADNGTPPEIIIQAEGQKLLRESVVSRQDGLMIPGGKKKLTDDGTNVPLIANWPGTITAGQVVDDLVDMSDYLPTFAELTNSKLPEGREIDGHSFAPRLLGNGKSSRRFAYAEEAVLPKPGGVEPDGKSSGRCWVRTGDWKLYNDGRLFHMNSDLQENRPINANNDTPASKSARQDLEKALAELKNSPQK
ncbi:sulfatase-like hydrolase/transferase [Rubinisphaera sp. JC750]|uniref:sulfatase-like hydrolase/transferase n=1 Tax=Rubinisphaera sp. JC750 TaxID=2898658 RepID=UPI001F02E7B9|nr:sulfatase-like hydrolase/transferase [Rubinisphaera sp. JC750]